MLVYIGLTHRKAPRFSSSVENVKELGSSPLVSVIVTAKNEEEKIARCLRSVSKQSYANLEIILVDDSSTDRTTEIALESMTGDSRFRIVEAGSKPDGWVGKSWPCWRGYESSRGELLLFLDADSILERSSTIKETVNYLMVHDYDMLSITPEVELKGIWASATLPLVALAIDLFYPLTKVNDPTSKRAYVYGTFILTRKKGYEEIDGHRAVRELLVEDAALAERMKSSGHKLRVEIATGYLSTDWEEERSKIYSGLERVTSFSIRNYGLISIVNAVALFFIALFPIFVFVIGTILVFQSGSLADLSLIFGLIAGISDIVIFVVMVGIELRLVSGRVGLLPFLYPLGILIFMSAIVTASFKVSRGSGIEWKGSLYTQSVSSARPAHPDVR